jgi:hypothetical protein
MAHRPQMPNRLNVAFGSLAEVKTLHGDVRFTPETRFYKYTPWVADLKIARLISAFGGKPRHNAGVVE